jgi:hypothetical protein
VSRVASDDSYKSDITVHKNAPQICMVLNQVSINHRRLYTMTSNIFDAIIALFCITLLAPTVGRMLLDFQKINGSV